MENKLIEWVKKEKTRRGWSYRDIADNCDRCISAVHVNETVEYKQPISAKFVWAISISFNIPIWEAFYMAEMLPDKHKEQTEILTKFNKLPPESKSAILEQIDFLLFKNKIEI